MPKVAFTADDVAAANRADKHQVKVNNAYVKAMRSQADALLGQGIKPGSKDYAEKIDPILADIGATDWLTTRIEERISHRVPGAVKVKGSNPFRS